ncbi:hypothetical protein QT231_14290 [Halomonas sp. SpR1]|uniref:hypothetical protein n=1 Tax=Halomonas sp. SpR1 TaxID=3050462 RepID=UPI0027E3D2FA|nr:hypothetical protein [Halomonas sp. SpR1]MDQ7733878.1 hypothetical protein [Halomonas sp. SpR1]
MPLIGYASVSTDAQDLILQRDTMAKVGDEKIFEEVASGDKTEPLVVFAWSQGKGNRQAKTS